jgi:opacity protein-like surface antigen
MGRRFGNGFFIGLAAGGNLPRGQFNDFYQSGWNVAVPFGWQTPGRMLGVRADVAYSRMSGRDFDISNFGTGTTRDPQIWSGMVDLKLSLPLAPTSSWRPAIYALGGGGVHYFRNFTSSFNAVAGTGTGTAFQTQLNGSSQTKFGLNGGAGLSLGLGAADLFVESRYVSVFTSGNNTNWVPINVGITFF